MDAGIGEDEEEEEGDGEGEGDDEDQEEEEGALVITWIWSPRKLRFRPSFALKRRRTKTTNDTKEFFAMDVCRQFRSKWSQTVSSRWVR